MRTDPVIVTLDVQRPHLHDIRCRRADASMRRGQLVYACCQDPRAGDELYRLAQVLSCGRFRAVIRFADDGRTRDARYGALSVPELITVHAAAAA